MHAIYVVTTRDTVTLATEDELDGSQAAPVIYALQPHATKDVALLAHAGHTLARDPAYAGQRDAGLAAFGALSNRFHVNTAPQPVPLPKTEKEAPQRKRRKVVKQVRVKNEKGYMITKDVEVSESEDEAPPPVPAPAPAAPQRAPTRAAPKGKGAKQPSLMSFFSKSS